MIRSVAALALCAVLFAGPAQSQTQGNPQLAAVIAAYERLDQRLDPITAGSEGMRDALRRLPDASRETELASRGELQTLMTQLQAVPAQGLSDTDSVNRDILLRTLRVRIEGIGFDQGRVPFGNDGGFFSIGDYLGYATPINSADDAEAYLARMEAVPTLYRQSIINARRGMQTGWTQPRIIVDRLIAQANAQVSTLEETYLNAFAQVPSTISAAQAEQYRTRVRAIVRDRILPEHRTFITFMQNEYLPRARRGLGIGSVSGGRDYYRYLVRFHTTTDMTPEQIHQLGLSEVARIRARMETEMRASGFHGTFAEFQHFLHTDPQFYATNADDLVEKYSEVAKRADGQLPRLFGRLPRLPYGIRVIPASQAESSTTAYYNQGSPALGVAGTYYVNTTHLDQRPLYEMPALTLHESVPGHHLQIALAQEQADLPYFRRTTFFTAFVEGWGLYAESLGEDMGMYRTPYERFGRLSYEMWRACRLVADTGIHWMGWDIEHARQCFADNTALAPHNIQTELERYVANPGQALAYKIGELRLQALRRRATETLGAHFDIRAFHDEVLDAGALPMDVLERRVNAWIAAQPRS